MQELRRESCKASFLNNLTGAILCFSKAPIGESGLSNRLKPGAYTNSVPVRIWVGALYIYDILRNMKTCSKCGEEKEISEFGPKGNGKTQSWCKPCSRDYGRSHYAANSQKYKDRLKENRPKYKSRNKQFILDYLKVNSCVDCGESDVEVLQFDHIELIGQTGHRIGYFLSSSIKILKEEIAKCEVRCANCHVKRTRRQLGWFREENNL
jgi:hypothetical protein